MSQATCSLVRPLAHKLSIIASMTGVNVIGTEKVTNDLQFNLAFLFEVICEWSCC